MGKLWNWIIDKFFSQEDNEEEHILAEFLAGVYDMTNVEGKEEPERQEQIYAILRGWL